MLAFLVKRSTATGWGLITGMLSVVLFSILREVSWLYYNVVGALVVLAVGSVLGSGKKSRASLIASGADCRGAVVRLSPTFGGVGGWSDVARWDRHPLKIAAFPRHTEKSELMGLENTTERDSIARLP